MSFSDPASLKAIVAGPLPSSMVPGAGSASRQFTGSLGKPPDRLAISLPYLVHFEGNVGELTPGASVTLRGFTVGKVARVDLTTDPQAGEITTTAMLDLDPTRFHISKPPKKKRVGRHFASHTDKARCNTAYAPRWHSHHPWSGVSRSTWCDSRCDARGIADSRTLSGDSSANSRHASRATDAPADQTNCRQRPRHYPTTSKNHRRAAIAG